MLDELSYPVFKEFKKVYRELKSLKEKVCCLASNSGGAIKVQRYVGDGITINYTVTGFTNIFNVSTDGRNNDNFPGNEYTITSTGITFNGSPAIGSVILIFYQ